MLRIVESSSNAARIAVAEEFLDRFTPGNEVLIIGTTRSVADDFVRQYSLSKGATFGLHRFSFLQLVAHAASYELARKGLAPSTGLGEHAIAARALFESRAKGILKRFAPLAGRPGLARVLVRTLREIRLGGIASDVVERAGPNAAELAVLLEQYTAELEDAATVDRAALLEIATRTIRDRRDEVFSNAPVLLLDVPIDSDTERVFVQELCSGAPAALATVPLGDARTLAALQSNRGHEHLMVRGPESPELNRLQSFLFSNPPARAHRKDDRLCFLSAPGESRECVEIARRIVNESRKGTAFDRIAIAIRAPQVYASLLEAALERAGIPAYFVQGTRRPDPSGRAFLLLLTCAAEGFSARRFAEYLSLAQVPRLDASGAPPKRAVWVSAVEDELFSMGRTEQHAVAEPEPVGPDSKEQPVLEGSLRAPWRWEELLVESAVIGGVDRWRRRLNGLRSELQLKLRALLEEEPDSSPVTRLERELRDLEHLSNFTLPVIDALAALPSSADWGEWLHSLEVLSPMVLHRPERVLAVLAELRPMATVGPVSLEEVVQVLSERLTQVQDDPPRRRFGRVFVGTPHQLRGRSFEVVFVPGLAERIFPRRPHEDPILLDSTRERIQSDGIRLAMQEDRVLAERLQLRLAVGAARERIYLSYPRFEVAMARPRVPSFYAFDVKRTLSGTVPSIDQFEREAAEESGALLSWPAPPDAASAIDDLEHDLATLWPLLLADPKEVSGRARYLLELNQSMGRSLRARWARWRPRWTQADGICVAGDAVCSALNRHRLTSRPYSPSSLQHFAACPYRFFLAGVLKMEARVEIAPLQYMDPLTKGSMVHAIQARLARGLLEKGLLPITAERLEETTDILDEIIRAVDQEYRELLVPAIERVWQDEVDRIRADLRGWLLRTAESKEGWVPVFIEFAFGLPADPRYDPASKQEFAVLPGGYRLRGVIDSVERKQTGQLRVTDYKTGKDRSSAGLVVGYGEILQPALYPLALEALGLGKVGQGRLAHCAGEGGFSERVVPVNGATQKDAETVLHTIDEAIATAFLPPAPKEGACRLCDFMSVCGPYEEIRIKRKDQKSLSSLFALRQMP